MVTELAGRHPREAVDDASPHETIVADRDVRHTITEPLTITTPGLTLLGCNLRLAEEANENLVEVRADGVRFSEFTLDGNRARQSGERQSSGVVVTGATNVSITNGVVRNVSRHGLRIVDTSTRTSRVEGILRPIRAVGPSRTPQCVTSGSRCLAATGVASRDPPFPA